MWRPDWLADLRNFGPWGGHPLYVRLGRQTLQAWALVNGGSRLHLLGSQPADHLMHTDYPALAQAIANLCQALPSGSAVTVLADSYWLPLSLLNTGPAPLSRQQVHALTRHRFVELFGEDVRAWDVQCDYLSGQHHAMAFACPSGLTQAVRQALGQALSAERAVTGPANMSLQSPALGSAASSVRLTGLQPTFSWAWNHAWRSQSSREDQWLLLAEQDRSVLAHVHGGQVRALNACAPNWQSLSEVAQGLPVQALRCGVVSETHAVLGISLESRADMNMVSPIAGVRWYAAQSSELTA